MPTGSPQAMHLCHKTLPFAGCQQKLVFQHFLASGRKWEFTKERAADYATKEGLSHCWQTSGGCQVCCCASAGTAAPDLSHSSWLELLRECPLLPWCPAVFFLLTVLWKRPRISYRAGCRIYLRPKPSPGMLLCWISGGRVRTSMLAAPWQWLFPSPSMSQRDSFCTKWSPNFPPRLMQHVQMNLESVFIIVLTHYTQLFWWHLYCFLQ